LRMRLPRPVNRPDSSENVNYERTDRTKDGVTMEW